MAGHTSWAEVRAARVRELAKDRNGGQEPDELHLAYEAELMRVRMERDWLLAEADDDVRSRYFELMRKDPPTT